MLIGILGCVSLICLYISSEKQRVKGYSVLAFKGTSLGSERSNLAQRTSIMASRQQERKRRVSAYCKTAVKTSALQPRALNHFIVDNKHKVVYCYIPKVACTTWKKIMA